MFLVGSVEYVAISKVLFAEELHEAHPVGWEESRMQRRDLVLAKHRSASRNTLEISLLVSGGSRRGKIQLWPH